MGYEEERLQQGLFIQVYMYLYLTSYLQEIKKIANSKIMWLYHFNSTD